MAGYNPAGALPPGFARHFNLSFDPGVVQSVIPDISLNQYTNLRQDTPKPEDNTPIIDTQKYGFTTSLRIATLAAPILALPQPSTTRLFLVIQNKSILAPVVNVDFSGEEPFTLAPGQAAFFDAWVPQDDVYLQGAGGVVVIIYCNKAT